MAARHRPPATFDDLAKLPDEPPLEIIRGTIVEKALPTFEHGMIQRALGGVVGRRFGGPGGGRWPGGWWIGAEVDVEYGPHDLCRHDLVGWRRERVPERLKARPVRVRPDWVCEILSPSNEKRDLVEKLHILQGAGVPHYWVVNAEEKILMVYRLEANGYVLLLSASSGETVRAEPFHAVELPIDVLFGDADDD